MWIFLQEINASRPVIGHMTNIMVTLYFYHASNEGRPMKHSKMVNAVYSCFIGHRGLGLGIEDWDWGLGIRIGNWDWELGLRIEIGH